MSQKQWIGIGERSMEVLVAAPDLPPGFDDVVARFDAALAGWPGPVPGWYETVERRGAWLYPVAVAAAGVVLYGLGVLDIWLVIGLGASIGLIVATSVLLVARGVARLASRGGARDREDRSLEAYVRLSDLLTFQQVAAVMGGGRVGDAELHRLAWRIAAPDDPDGDVAAGELHALWKEVAPEAAALFEAVEAELDRTEEGSERPGGDPRS